MVGLAHRVSDQMLVAQNAQGTAGEVMQRARLSVMVDSLADRLGGVP
jgi:hypothetical protein